MAVDKSDIEAGRSFVRLYIRDETVEKLATLGKDLHKLGGQIKSIGIAMAAASGAVVAFGTAAAKRFSTVGDAIDKMAARTGMSAEAVSALGFAAEQSGSNIETVERILRRMQDTLIKASNGSKESAKALDILGLSAEELLAKSPDEQLLAFADAFLTIEDPAERTALAMDVFGRAGTELLPMLMEGSAGIKRLMDRAAELGITMGGPTARAGAKLNDQFGELWSAIDGLTVRIGKALEPMVKAVAKAITEATIVVGRFIDENKWLVQGLYVASLAVFGLGSAFIVAGQVLEGMKFSWMALTMVIGTFSGAALPVVAIVAAIAVSLGTIVYGLYRATNGFEGLTAPLKEVWRLMKGLGEVVAEGGLDALDETLSRAGPFLRAFMDDAFSQIPQIAGYYLGRTARELAIMFHNLTASIINTIVNSIGRLIRAVFEGDFLATLADVMREGLLGGPAAFVEGLFDIGDAPGFKPSDATKKEWRSLMGEVERRGRPATATTATRDDAAVTRAWEGMASTPRELAEMRNTLRQQLDAQMETNELLKRSVLAYVR